MLAMNSETISNLIAQLIPVCISIVGKLIGAILVLLIGLRLVSFLVKRLKKGRSLNRLNDTVKSFVINLINIALKITVIITAATILGVPMASVITLVGSCGVAIGLALQGSLSNIAGSLIILLFKPFSVGDVITVEGETGTVDEIGIFYTRITTPDNRRVILPNGVVSNEKMVNISANRTRRADFTFTVGYDSDIELVRSTILDAIFSTENLLKEPEPGVFLTEHGDSALVFTAYAWCECANYLKFRSDITERVKTAFDEKSISIPYPQLDVHIQQ